MLVVWLLGAAASAQPGEDPPVDSAEALIDSGISLREQGLDAAARDVFRRAVDAGAGPRGLAQLALAEQAMGAFVEADAHLRAALAADDPWITRHREVLEDALARIQAQLGRLDVSRDVIAGCAVTVDGEPVGTTPLPEPLRRLPGEVILAVACEGHERVELTVEVRVGELTRVAPVLRRAPVAPAVIEADRATIAAPAVTTTRVTPRSPWQDVVIAALTTTGLAAVGLGVALGLREAWVQAYNDPTACPSPRQVVCADLRAQFEAAERAAVGLGVSTALLALAAAAGVVAWVVDEDAIHASLAVHVGGASLQIAGAW